MNTLGALSQLFHGSPTEVAAAFRRHELKCVQLRPSFSGWPFRDPGLFTQQRCREVAEAFQSASIRIVSVSNSANLMDSNLDQRHRSVMCLHALIRYCRDFGTDKVVTESGSSSPNSPWAPHPHTRSSESWSELRTILREALDLAAIHGVQILLKPDSSHILASVDDSVRLRDEVQHPSLGFVMDPASYLERSQPVELNRDLERLFADLGPSAPLAHAKDLRYGPHGITKPRAGLGMLDYGLFLRLLGEYQPEAPVILEHVRPDELDATRTYLEQYLRSPRGDRD